MSIVINGEPLEQLPLDLYIPPQALEVFLSAFEGPLDLLLYLIKKQNINVLEIDVFAISEQYSQYIQMMQELNVELASDYLVMAATLAEVKSRMLLPRNSQEGDDEESDPRAELIRRLQAYEQTRQAAIWLADQPRAGMNWWMGPQRPIASGRELRPTVSVARLQQAYQSLQQRQQNEQAHDIAPEQLSTRARMSQILLRLQQSPVLAFDELLDPQEGRTGLVVTFFALLELAREKMLTINQSQAFEPIWIQSVEVEDDTETSH
ncbi:segregation and condensation protein A [Salinibius halmophilus]|uniref:segregation and condensation protein A n=1 Tax=Salinibius halmophilus TaxID=1853216 RepID=UPI000E66FF8E|nr:ScpA family protein [Salinibius halmophilus]